MAKKVRLPPAFSFAVFVTFPYRCESSHHEDITRYVRRHVRLAHYHVTTPVFRVCSYTIPRNQYEEKCPLVKMPPRRST